MAWEYRAYDWRTPSPQAFQNVVAITAMSIFDKLRQLVKLTRVWSDMKPRQSNSSVWSKVSRKSAVLRICIYNLRAAILKDGSIMQWQLFKG